MSEYVIETRGLTKYFGRKCAVDGVTLRVPRGEVVALLGRNGSGKTTFVRMVLGLIGATRGEARVLGEDSGALSPAVRGRVGYMAESHPLYGWMTVRQIGEYQESFYPGWRWEAYWSIVRHFRLAEGARVSGLSRGERAGVALAVTLAPGPEVLVLDDPALGLDPVARRLLLEAMVGFTRDGARTILFSSHLLADVERVADRVAVLDRSVLRVDAPVEVFRERVRQWVLVFDGQAPAEIKVPGLLGVRRDGNEVRVTVANADESTERQLRATGAARVAEVPVGFEDAVIGYLGEREGTGFLAAADERGAA